MFFFFGGGKYIRRRDKIDREVVGSSEEVEMGVGFLRFNFLD